MKVEGWGEKEKGLMNMDNSVLIVHREVGWWRWKRV